jgi:hypothetical protein
MLIGGRLCAVGVSVYLRLSVSVCNVHVGTCMAPAGRAMLYFSL